MSQLSIKSPQMMGINYKGLRGVFSELALYAQKENKEYKVAIPMLKMMAVEYAKDYIPLSPGEETLVGLKIADLKPNADVKAIDATLHVASDPAIKDKKISQTAEITEDKLPKKTYEVDTDLPSLPRNLSIKLDGGDVFYTFPGDMQAKGYKIPDFSSHINDYLDKLPPDTKEITLTFLVRSDTHGKVKITHNKNKFDYSLIQTKSWPNDMDDTIRFDRNFEPGYAHVERLDIGKIAVPKGKTAALKEIVMDAGGQFGAERVLGSVSTFASSQFATIDPEFSAAQEIILNTPVTCTGITGFFLPRDQAEVYVEIQPASSGFPADGQPLAGATLELAPPNKKNNGSSNRWTYFQFDAPAELSAGTPYWVVVKGIKGKTRFGLEPIIDKYPGRLLVNRGGQQWKSIDASTSGSAAPSAAQLRLVYTPNADNQTAAVEMALESPGKTLTPFKKIEPGEQPQSIAFSLSNPGNPDVKLLIKSHALGSLSIANVIREYSGG